MSSRRFVFNLHLAFHTRIVTACCALQYFSLLENIKYFKFVAQLLNYPFAQVILFKSTASWWSTRLGRREPRTAKGSYEKAGLQDELRRQKRREKASPALPSPWLGAVGPCTVLSHMLAGTQISCSLPFEKSWEAQGRKVYVREVPIELSPTGSETPPPSQTSARAQRFLQLEIWSKLLVSSKPTPLQCSFSRSMLGS